MGNIGGCCSLGTAASGGAVFQKLQATNPEKKSIGSTATVELTMLAEAPPRTELPTVASAFCVAHISPSDLPAALRERLALRRILGAVRGQEQLCKTWTSAVTSGQSNVIELSTRNLLF